MSSNRDEQQQQQQQQQQIPYTQQQTQRGANPFLNTIHNNNTFYPNSATHNSYLLNNNQEPINNYYQLQQHQQQLYQPQQQQTSQYNFQTFVPEQPPSLQQFNDIVSSTEPDEFIIDLLRKPQERLFLLKLELEIEGFIKEEGKLRLDLPSMNSYQRLMVHKLASYYKLNHYPDAMRKSVYLCKTFTTALPSVRLQDVRLTENESTTEENNTNLNQDENNQNSQQPQSTPQFKIMRRSAGSSPSSRNLNADDASKESRKNMTLEERKTAYEEARARIFQGNQ